MNELALFAALVEGYSQGISSAGERFALSSEMSSQQAFWCNGKTIEPFLRSRYGMTFSRLTDRCGEELLTWYRAGFHAKPIRPKLRERMLQTISGRKCDGSWQMSLPVRICRKRRTKSHRHGSGRPGVDGLPNPLH